MAFTEEQLAMMRRQLGLRPDADAATITAAVAEVVDEWGPPSTLARRTARPESTPPRLVAGHLGDVPLASDVHDIEQVIEWGVGTGRFVPARATFWRAQAAAERARTGSTAATEGTIRGLRPLYYADAPTATAAGSEPASATPLLDALDRAIYGPSQAERERATDLAAEAELRAQLDAEAEAAAEPPLTADDERRLFGSGA